LYRSPVHVNGDQFLFGHGLWADLQISQKRFVTYITMLSNKEGKVKLTRQVKVSLFFGLRCGKKGLSMSKTGLQFLREIELFKDLTTEELQRVYDLAVERSYERGEYVFLEGQARESVYFIRRGIIKILKVDEEGREHIVNILGKGKMFPHVGFFQDSPYPGTAQVMESAVLLVIRRQ
jgi:hypothetical protein